MQAECLIHTALFLQVLHDVPGADAHFLTLLEADIDFAGQLILVVVEDAGSTQYHGSMGVMTAGVHQTVDLRLEGNIGFLMDRQGIDITTEGDGLAGAAGVDQANHIGASHTGIGNAHLIQLFADASAGPDFLVGQFRMPVEFLAQADDIFLIFLCVLMDIEHISIHPLR